MRDLVMVTGLGDNVAGYRAAAPFWWAWGFRTHVFNFRWRGRFTEPPEINDLKLSLFMADFEARLDRLRYAIYRLHNPYLYGASAGGTAILNALLMEPVPTNVGRVAVVASPILRDPQFYWENLLLRQSLTALHPRLRATRPGLLKKIMLFVGDGDERVGFDESVPNTFSEWPLFSYALLPGHSHNDIIMRSLTTCSQRLATWFKEGY